MKYIETHTVQIGTHMYEVHSKIIESLSLVGLHSINIELPENIKNLPEYLPYHEDIYDFYICGRVTRKKPNEIFVEPYVSGSEQYVQNKYLEERLRPLIGELESLEEKFKAVKSREDHIKEYLDENLDGDALRKKLEENKQSRKTTNRLFIWTEIGLATIYAVQQTYYLLKNDTDE